MAKNKDFNLADLQSVAGSTRNVTARTSSAPARGKLLGSHVTEETHHQFRLIAVEKNLTMENAHAQALNDWFAKHGKPEIAPMRNGRKKK